MSLFAIETGAAVAALLIALLWPRLCRKQFLMVEGWFQSIASRKQLSIWFVAAAFLLLRLAILPVMGIPEPSVHDEFSNLLAADTFSHGRLANSTHPMWVHFETFHVNHLPTYMSMYPPGQGLFLAAGQILFGHPWFGVLLAISFLCASVTWMLQGWMPPGWAMLGGFVTMIRFGLFTYWSDGYWGSPVAAAGGALVLGAYPRLKGIPSTPVACALASGLFLLAITRPYEGFVMCLALAFPIGRTMLTSLRANPAIFTRRVFAPFCLCCVAAGLWMGYFNFKVYGSAVSLPYAANRAQYAVAPVFVFQKESPVPDYNHAVMRDFFLGWERKSFRSATTFAGYSAITLARCLRFWFFFISPLFTIPILLALPMLVDSSKLASLWLAFVANTIAVMLCAFTTPHYWAPSCAAILTILLQAIRYSRTLTIRGRRFGVAFVRLLLVAMVCLAALRAFVPGIDAGHQVESWQHRHVWFSGREKITEQLRREGGKHLIVVRYGTNHNPLAEWVYNAADIDSSPVVWAREIDSKRDAGLFAYFRERQVWLLNPDEIPVALRPYPFPKNAIP